MQYDFIVCLNLSRSTYSLLTIQMVLFPDLMGVSLYLLTEFTFRSPALSTFQILSNLTSKQKVFLITPNHWKLLSFGPPGESSCLTIALIRVAYANIHPFERFFTNMMLFRLPIIVYIIAPLYVLMEFDEWHLDQHQKAVHLSETDRARRCANEKLFVLCQKMSIRGINKL